MVATSEVLAALYAAHARPRAEVATAIHRKETPELAFHVVRS